MGESDQSVVKRGACPVCGDTMTLDWEAHLNLDAIFDEDLEAEGLD